MAEWHIAAGLICISVGILLHLKQESLRRWSRRTYRGFAPLIRSWSFPVPLEAVIFLAVGLLVLVLGVVESLG